MYVVTRHVANSLSERLTNQLLEAGRVVSAGVAGQEIKNVEIGCIIIYTRSMAEAAQAGSRSLIDEPLKAIASGLDAENLILNARQGDELVHLIKLTNGSVSGWTSTP